MNFAWILAVLAVLALGGALVVFLDIRPGLAPFSACAAISLFVLAAGWCRLLWFGAWLAWVLCAVLAALALYEDRRVFARYLVSPGVLAFAAGCLVMGAISTLHGYFYSQWDEYSHWGPFFKWMFENNALHIWYDAELFHPTYPQAVQVFYYFMARFSRSFSESDTFVAMVILFSAAASAVLCGLSWKRPFPSVLAILAMPLFFVLFPAAWAYITVYQDAMLGALFGAALCAVLAVRSPSLRDAAPVLLGCTLLTQIKANGFLFAMICAAMYLFVLVLGPHRGRRLLRLDRAVAVSFGTVCGAAFAAKAVWSLLLAVTGNSVDQFGQAQRGGLAEQVRGLLDGTNPIGATALERFKINFVHMPVVYNGYGTPLIMLVLLMGFGILLSVWLVRSVRENGAAAMLCTMPLFFAAYMATLAVTYLCYMTPFEAQTNASSNRYIATFFVGWVMLVLAAVLMYGENALPHLRDALPAAAAAAVLVLEANLMLQHDALNLAYQPENAGRVNFDAVCAQMSGALAPDETVWVLYCGDGNVYKYMFHYLMYPARISLRMPVDITLEPFGTKEYLTAAAAENGVDDLLVYTVDENFVKECGGLFSDGLAYVAQNALPCLYRVQPDGTFALTVQTSVDE